ncbi:MAG TPA: methylmalonyl-CoA epimerase [Acidobacteriota bacterium]|nr:methylmalonyl-CoA epimerase [Acidobacteriota bacterium]
MIRDIDHVAVVVKSIDEKLPLYTQVLGFRLTNIETVEHMGVRVAMLQSESETTHIELLEPIREDTGVSRFLQKKGEAIHHLCFLVEDLQSELNRLAGQGLRLIDTVPRKGEGGSMVGFLHPEACHGVLIELKQAKKD